MCTMSVTVLSLVWVVKDNRMLTLDQQLCAASESLKTFFPVLYAGSESGSFVARGYSFAVL